MPIAVLLLAVAGGCRRETADPDMVAAVETTATTDTSVTLSATTTAATGGTVSAMLPADKEFVIRAAGTVMAEVMLSEPAVKRGRSARVKAFARRLIAEHGRSNQELQLLATNKGLALPTALDGDAEQKLERLQALSGVGFDREYMTRMVEDHQAAVAMFENAAKTVQDADVRAWIGKTLPVLRDHLDRARSVQSKLR
ncbi:MAG TPA: DUF4142 domain-containing protein [Thermoanaerobaculia bacterium]|nr:DUF4142 domain-containing protein [Thermoanaerobaculia bacterium]